MTQTFTRSAGRAANQLRPVRITRGFTVHAEGSVLIEFGGSGGRTSGPLGRDVAATLLSVLGPDLDPDYRGAGWTP